MPTNASTACVLFSFFNAFKILKKVRTKDSELNKRCIQSLFESHWQGIKKTKKKQQFFDKKWINLPVCMNGWLSPSGMWWFHRVLPGKLSNSVYNFPAFPPPQKKFCFVSRPLSAEPTKEPVCVIHGFCLFVLRLNVPVNNFSVISGRSHRFLGN